MQKPTASFTAPSHQAVTPVPETVPVNSHTNSSSAMSRTSRESRRSNATSSKNDGNGSFYEMELEGGCVENAPTTGLGSIGEDSGRSAPLGPCDGGRQAWLFFGSAFMIEALLWGLPATFGTFNAFYKKHPNFRGSPFVPLVGALSTSIPFFGAPFVTPYVSKYRQYQRQMVWSGFAICVLSLILASFATNIWALIAFQGAGFGFGVLVLYYAVLAMLDSWFIQRRGEAYGYLFGAAGAAGIGLPFMFQALLDRFDYATTLRFYALFVVCLVGTPMALCRGRYTYTTPDLKASTNIDKSILKNPVFYMFWAANMLQGIAFVLPGFYLTRFANALSLRPVDGTTVFSLLNGTQVFAQFVVGVASDKFKFSPVVIAAVSSLVSASFLVLWLYARSFAALLAFAILFGFFAGGYSVLWPRLNISLTADKDTQLFLYGYLAFGRGVGNIIAVAFSVFLMDNTGDAAQDPISAFRGMILLAMSVLFIGGFISIVSLAMSWLSSRRTKSLKSSTSPSSSPKPS